MSKVVEGMNKERWLIFRAFGVGLLSLLAAVACSTWLLMQWEVRIYHSRGVASSRVHATPSSGGAALHRAALRRVPRARIFGVPHLQEVRAAGASRGRAVAPRAHRLAAPPPPPSRTQAGELVRFDDFLKALPKAIEEDDLDEEEMAGPVSPTASVL